jgi:hypothetical protein
MTGSSLQSFRYSQHFWWSSSLYNILQFFSALYHSDTNIFLTALFLNTLSLCYSLRAADQVSHPYKTKFSFRVIYLLHIQIPDGKTKGAGIVWRVGCGLDEREIGTRWSAGAILYFSLLHSIQIDSGADPISYPIGTDACFPGVKRQGRERRSYTSTPPYVIMAWCLINHRDSFKTF